MNSCVNRKESAQAFLLQLDLNEQRLFNVLAEVFDGELSAHSAALRLGLEPNARCGDYTIAETIFEAAE